MLIEVVDLFYRSVHSIDCQIYSAVERSAWAPLPPNYSVWAARISDKPLWIVQFEQTVVGFLELDPTGYINCLYTHPDYQHKGVASALLKQAESVAERCGLPFLKVDASKVAQPLFLRHGYQLIRENRVQRNGVELINFRMEKALTVVICC